MYAVGWEIFRAKEIRKTFFAIKCKCTNLLNYVFCTKIFPFLFKSTLDQAHGNFACVNNIIKKYLKAT